MKIRSLLCLSAVVTVVGCGPSTTTNNAGSSTSGALSTLDSCATPATFGTPALQPSLTEFGTVYYPSTDTVGSEAWVVLQSGLDTYYGTQSASLHYSTDAWATAKDAAMASWCTVSDQNGSTVPVFGVSLGKLPVGTTVSFAVHLTPPTDYFQQNIWLNNNSKNYSFTVTPPSKLSWVGSTGLSIGSVSIANTSVPLDHAITLTTQTYPAGAAISVEVDYIDGNGKPGKVALDYGSTGAGPSANNDLWTGTLPATLNSAAYTYVAVATDGTGKQVTDNGSNTAETVSPVAYPINWAGNLGCWEVEEGQGQYNTGCGLPSDQTISLGCNSGGEDGDFIETPAIQVYVPGITDRKFASKGDINAFGQLVSAAVYTNATSNGAWGTLPAGFIGQWGDNFVFAFFAQDDMCQQEPSQGLKDGTYQYKLRFSTDGGATYYYAGTTSGDNLTFNFKYANAVF